MSVTPEDNRLMTLVEGDAPLGNMLREFYWLPAVPSSAVVADGKPFRLRIVGGNYVVFRDTSGRVGVLDEACPHRRASLALARNEDNGLRCIYHGWKFNTAGEVTEAPNANERHRGKFCQTVITNKYRAEDRGGIIWVWLGKGEIPPAFPDLPFTALPDNQRAVTSNVVPSNWLQGVEATMDTTHLSFLHSSTIELQGGSRTNVLAEKTARLEFDEKPYGYRYAAIRRIGDGKAYVRINNFVMPWYSVICAPEEGGPGTVFMSVPVDDTHHRAWFVHFNMSGALGNTMFSQSPDVVNWPPLPPGSPEDNWGQNRDVMARGHFSGFPQHLATEDFAMFMSQGPVYDRAAEQLCDADGAIVRLRRILLQTVRKFQQTQIVDVAARGSIDYASIVSVGRVIPQDTDWRSLVH
jgi:phenylpropionate dioxygenase-like ring-hydroxylating dioxygenase large terminal subunit